MRKGQPRAHLLAVLTIAVLLAACASPAAAPTGAPQSPVAAATAAGTPDPAGFCKDCWPLTGRPAKLGPVDKRPLLVKIDNVPAAPPHYGTTQADLGCD